MVKLLPSGSQHEALKATLRRVNEACDYASEVAWEKGTFGNKYRLQQATYHPIKERFGLASLTLSTVAASGICSPR
jgi:putative transposase